jgi:alpha-L-rhamnosidase
MQTTFEDGPRRDQRLWIGDMRLQAQANYVTFKNPALVKRCLYLFAGLPGPNGLLPACVFEKPSPMTTDTFIVDYSILYGAAVLDYVQATGDTATAHALWPTVRRQFEIFAPNVGADGLFTAPKGQWAFIDWNMQLDRAASMQGVLLYGYRQALELAKLAGANGDAADYPAMIERLQKAARTHFYDEAAKVCVSGPQRQVSWASQAWLTLAGGVLSEAEAQAALRKAVLEDATAIRPATPYLYHHVAEAMVQASMPHEALELIRSYWGSMVENGADTFWEAYDPKDSLFSPYGDVHINSFCHAWSCTPAYLFRSGRLSLN